MKNALIQSLEEWRDSLSAFRKTDRFCANILIPIEASISEINRLSNELAEKESENARLLRDMVLHERALEQAMEREGRLREWKEYAMACLNEWEEVWKAAGKSGEIGASKAAVVLEYILLNDPHQARRACEDLVDATVRDLMTTPKNCCCGDGRICPSHGDTTPHERTNYNPPELSPDGMEDEADALREELHKAAKEFAQCDAISAGFTKYSRACNRLENAAIAYGRIYSANAASKGWRSEA